ncbi:MAG TPA: transcription termination/antitermination NusG family protein [Nitrobacter sp.]|nr:transcription termination/antitermination NusG family protein [Nitrobacter sp.]
MSGVRVMRAGNAGWCILTVKWRQRERTLKLSEALAVSGFDVWVPVETRRVDVPRMNVKRDVTRPLFPGYIFVQIDRERVVGLIQYTDPHPLLNVFRDAEGCPSVIAERHLARLRAWEAQLAERHLAELRKTKRKSARMLSVGDTLRARDGSFGGKTGTVISSDRRKTFVFFDRFFGRVEIPTSNLFEDEAYELQSATDYAAKLVA